MGLDKQFVWCERIEDETAPPFDRNERLKGSDFVADVLPRTRRVQDRRGTPRAPAVRPARSVRPLAVQEGIWGGAEPAGDELADLLDEAESMAVDLLLGGRPVKILKVQIEGFGRFANLNLGPFQRPMVIFHGPNEAGKTTLMEFIRRVLFGFPDGRSRLNLYRPLHGGRHGGGLVIASDNDEVVTVRRTSGRQGGQVTLTTEDGAPLSTTELGRFMGNATKDVFEKVFSFTLDELHSDELLSDESVNGQIYGAGMGVATLPKTMKELEKKTTLFLKGGRQHDIAKAANQLRDIESRLEGIENNAREFARLTTELNHAETTLKEKNAELRKRQTLVDDLKRDLNAWDDWVELENTENRLAKLPTIENFPEDGVNRLEKLEEHVNTANIEHDRAGRRLANAEAEVGKPVEHEAILNHSDAINHLERSRNAFDASVRDLPKREAELKEHDRNLKKTMRDLGPDWNESRLENFDLSLIVQNDILDHESRLNTTQTEIGRIRAELAQRRGRIGRGSTE